VPANVFSVRFLQAQGFIGSDGYVVPPGKVAVVRDLDAYANTGLTASTIRLVGNTAWSFFYFDWGIDNQESIHFETRQVFDEGERFDVVIQFAPVDFTLSGWLLTKP
jgi:hypothetical protein